MFRVFYSAHNGTSQLRESSTAAQAKRGACSWIAGALCLRAPRGIKLAVTHQLLVLRIAVPAFGRTASPRRRSCVARRAPEGRQLVPNLRRRRLQRFGPRPWLFLAAARAHSIAYEPARDLPFLRAAGRIE